LKTIVVGLGNPILGDDGVGWKVAQEVERLLASSEPGHGTDIAVDYCALGGLSLMESLAGYEDAILVDALALDQPPGTVMAFPLEELPNLSTGHTTSVHDTSLQDALKMGASMGIVLPSRITVVGIAARRLYDFSESLSPEVADSVPVAARKVLDLLADRE
jgi:hydrogenase maturation protease